jgi:hypothetical protein
MNTARRPSGRKKEWNSYLTDTDSFKLSKEEMIKRKALLLSKHNILTNPAASKPKNITKIPKKKERTEYIYRENYSSDDDSSEIVLEAVERSRQTRRHTSYVDDRLKETVSENELLRFKSADIASKDRSNVSKNKSIDSSSKTIPISKKMHVESPNTIVDMNEIGQMISILSSELKRYEELSGRRNIFSDDVCDNLYNSPNLMLRPYVYVFLHLCTHVCHLGIAACIWCECSNRLDERDH